MLNVQSLQVYKVCKSDLSKTTCKVYGVWCSRKNQFDKQERAKKKKKINPVSAVPDFAQLPYNIITTENLMSGRKRKKRNFPISPVLGNNKLLKQQSYKRAMRRQIPQPENFILTKQYRLRKIKNVYWSRSQTNINYITWLGKTM